MDRYAGCCQRQFGCRCDYRTAIFKKRTLYTKISGQPRTLIPLDYAERKVAQEGGIVQDSIVLEVYWLDIVFEMVRPTMELSRSEIEQRLAVVAENLRALTEKAAALSGAADDEIINQQIDEQQAVYDELKSRLASIS
jgi:hypothetical protein